MPALDPAANFLDLLLFDFLTPSLVQEAEGLPPPAPQLRRTRSTRNRFIIPNPPLAPLPKDATKTFHPFSRLPVELQMEIFRLHTQFSIHETGDLKSDLPGIHGTVVFSARQEPRTKDKLASLVLKIRFACVGEKCKVLNLPSGMRVSHLAREVAMNTILRAPRPVDHGVPHCCDVVLVKFRG